MPTVYRVEQSEDAGQGKLDHSIAGAFTRDGKKSGQIMGSYYLGLLEGDTIIPLPHPLEASTLAKHKESFGSASLKGTLVRVQRRVCLQCGDLFSDPHREFSVVCGCGGGLAGSVITAPVLHYVFSLKVLESVVLSLLFLSMAFTLLGNLYLAVRFLGRRHSVRQQQCPKCGSDRAINLEKLAGKRTSVGDKGRWIQVSVAGKS